MVQNLQKHVRLIRPSAAELFAVLLRMFFGFINGVVCFALTTYLAVYDSAGRKRNRCKNK